MKKNATKILTPLFICFLIANSFAQDKSSHEIGIITGISSFTTDYGHRNEFNSNVGGNYGNGWGLVYYFTFTDYRYRWNQRTNYWQEHFKVRTEISLLKADLDHFGSWKDATYSNGELTLGAKKLRAHHGRTVVFNLGAQLEFHLVDIIDFGSRRIPHLKWSPYISTGLFVDFYDPEIWSERGDWKERGVLYPKWDPTVFPTASRDTPGITLSATLGFGTRRKLGEYSDILIESRWQYFFSNYVDGLHAKVDENKYNDWVVWLHIGYIYYLN